MPENTEFLGDVVADWLQKCVINLLSEWFEYVDRNAAEESAAFVVGRYFGNYYYIDKLLKR